MNSPQYSSKTVDHLGLVSGLCKEIGLVEFFDSALPKETDNTNISSGQLVLAMILNGLGFAGRTLHMFHQYFESKPLDRLIAQGIKSEHINDDVLGRCLDDLYNNDVSSLYQNLAEKVVGHLGLTCESTHLDSTSFHVDGEYADSGDDIQAIKLTKGYSRDHRPDLNQVILNLITENQAGIPVYMQACSGNTNDTEGFKKIVKSHVKSLKDAYKHRYLVADSALYCEETIKSLDEQSQLFITRVPQKIKQAKALVADANNTAFSQLKDGYSGAWFDSNYGDVPQKWLLIKSEQAFKREMHTLRKRIDKDFLLAQKSFHKLCRQPFGCKADARCALQEWLKKQTFIKVSDETFLSSTKYSTSGRPKKGDEGNTVFNIDGVLCSCVNSKKAEEEKKGLFIIATNDCSDRLDMQAMLDNYKAQQNVEKGFRFLKSPDFLTSSMYLKSPKRIEALLMIMTCCLMIYAALEHLIRKKLKEKALYFPSMKNKPCQKPTARWVFQCFIGIDELTIDEKNKHILNMTEKHQVILNCLGQLYWDFYS